MKMYIVHVLEHVIYTQQYIILNVDFFTQSCPHQVLRNRGFEWSFQTNIHGL